MINSMDSIDCLNQLNTSLERLKGTRIAGLSDPHYIKEVRGLLAKIIEMDDVGQAVFNVSSSRITDKLSAERLKKETVDIANELDELICQASFEATFHLNIPSQLYARLLNKITYIESIIMNLQKYLIIGE
jgi:hypothetical protein